jgi:hypothetical protein
MGRPYAAGREDISIARPQCIDRGDDFLFDIGDDAGLLEIDAECRKIIGDETEILVLGAARKDFIADQEDGGSGYCGHSGGPKCASQMSAIGQAECQRLVRPGQSVAPAAAKLVALNFRRPWVKLG